MDRIDRYPAVRKADVVDDYHGTRIADPYRWLENAGEPETAAWVEAENRLTTGFLAGPEREAIKKRLEQLFDYPRVSVPERHAGRTFYSSNTRSGPAAPSRTYTTDWFWSPELRE